MPDDALERLQIVIEADASSVAPGAAQAANAMEQFGRRTTAATRAAAESVKRYKEAFSAAQKSARLEMQKSGVSDAMDKTARRLEIEQARLRELRAQAAHYAYKGDTSSTGARANAAKIAQSEARVADLDKQSESLARRFGALEDQARAQEQIASAATSRAEQAQQAAVAIAQQEESERAQGAAAAESAQSTRAAAMATEESAQGAKNAAQATREMNAEMRSARQGPGIFSSIGRALRSMLLIRSVTSMARGFVRWLGQAAMANAQFRASVASIKGNLISAFAPIYDAIIPWLNALANAIANVVGWISRLVGWLLPGNHSGTEKMLAGIGGAAGGASKQMKQLLANFDELNVLERSSGGSGGGGGGGGSGSGGGGGVGGSSSIWNAASNAAKDAIDDFGHENAVETAAKLAAGTGALAALNAVKTAIFGGGNLIGGLGHAANVGATTWALGMLGIGAVDNWRSDTMRERVADMQQAYAEGRRMDWLKGLAQVAWGGLGGTIAQTGINGTSWLFSMLGMENPLAGINGADLALHPGQTFMRLVEQTKATEWMQNLVKGFPSALDAMQKAVLGDPAEMSQSEWARRVNEVHDPLGWIKNAGKEIGRNVSELWTGIFGTGNDNATAVALEEIDAQGRRTAATLRVGAGEVLGAVDATTLAVDTFGRTWDELSFAEKLQLIGQTGASAFGNISTGLLGVQSAAEATSANLNTVAEAVDRVKNNTTDMFETVRRAIDQQTEQWAFENDLTQAQQLTPGFRGTKLNTYTNQSLKYDVSASPSHGGINAPAAYAGSAPTASDISAAVAQGLKGAKVELDGKTLGSLIVPMLNVASRIDGKAAVQSMY